MKKFLEFQQEEFKKINDNIIGIGIDIEPISRFKNIFSMINNGKLKKLFYQSEIESCKSSSFPERELAKYWCLKEATVKAFASSRKLNIFDIEITNINPIIIRIHKNDKIFNLIEYRKHASCSAADRLVISIVLAEKSI